MIEGGGRGAEQEAGQTPARISRRTILKAAVGAGIAAGVAIAAKRIGFLEGQNDTISGMTEGGRPETPTPEQIVFGTPERFVTPTRAIIDSPDGSRPIGVNPIVRDVLNEEGQKIGRVLEVEMIANPGDLQASLDFRFQKDPQGNLQVLTNGAQSWSSSVAVGKHADLPVVKITEHLVGMRPYEKSLGGKTVPFYDPGPREDNVPDTEGRSYGWVGFRDLDPSNSEAKKNLILGVIPGFDGLEGIRFKKDGDSIVVTVSKNLEGVTSQRPVTFKVFLGSSDRRQKYADLMLAFSGELSKLVKIPLMKDRVIGFSWAAYGPGINQQVIQQEIEAGKGILDTYVIDDGWETDSGSLEVDTKKFPDFADLPRQMKEAGIEHPGLWIAPFKIKGQSADQLYKLHPDWFMKDEHGKPAHLPITGEGSLMLDISVPEVRTYLIARLTNLAKMGYEVFKADFLAVPFTHQLQNNDKTSVEYYREFFEEFRQSVREQLGKEVEIIGCGAPMMESIGLFNGMRMTGDSAMPNLEGWPGIGGAVPFLKRIPGLLGLYSSINTGMYHDALAVGGRRTLPLNGAYGLIWDGVHLGVDERIPLNPGRRERFNKSLLALNRLGIGNFFVGDSLERIGEQGRQAWKGFISIFKKGNVEIDGEYRKIPAIPKRFVSSK